MCVCQGPPSTDDIERVRGSKVKDHLAPMTLRGYVGQRSMTLRGYVGRESDHKAFLRLCEDHLSIKPALAPQGCRGLGHSTGQRGGPRRLLVHLRSESCAADLPSCAKQLRLCDEPYIDRHVYINADLSPVKAKMACEDQTTAAT